MPQMKKKGSYALQVLIMISMVQPALPLQSESVLSPPPEAMAIPASMCTVAVFKVLETKMNRTKILTVPLGESVRYNTMVVQPLSCAMQAYAGGHINTTIRMNVHMLPYRVMIEPSLLAVFPPTLVFSGLMSTISPTFAHPNYAIIPMGCQTVACAAVK